MELADDYLSLFKRNTGTIIAVSNSSFDIESPKGNQDNILSKLLLRQKTALNNDFSGFDYSSHKEILKKTSIYVGAGSKNLVENPSETQKIFEVAFEKQFEMGKTKVYLN